MIFRIEPEEFGDLRRLLVLKRYEQPPAGFYERFAWQVAARIRAGAQRVDDEVFSGLLAQVPWLHRVWVALETRPLLGGSFAAMICALLVSGALYSARVERAEMGWGSAQPAAQVSSTSPRPLFLQIKVTEGSPSGTLPGVTGASLFDQFNSGNLTQPGQAFSRPH